jgi:V/A-type H+-transporting ATPase subunit I
MIVPMAKVYIATRDDDRDRLLTALRELGMVHIVPVDAEQAVADEVLVQRVDTLRRAALVFESVEPAGERPNLDPVEAAEEAVAILRRGAERNNRLTSLYRQIEQLDLWGDTRLEDLDALDAIGLSPRFYHVPRADLSAVEAECLTPVGGDKDDVVVAVVDRTSDGPTLPETARELQRPLRDRPDIRREAAEIDAALQEDAERMRVLAHCVHDVRNALHKAQAEHDYEVASRSGLHEEGLYALQGWLPARGVNTLKGDLGKQNIQAAIQTLQPEDDEQPPTLVDYPRWAKPIKALFGVLGTVPGYREFDLSPFFMLSMPIFTAMLVGDAGYGLIFTLIGLLTYGKLARAKQETTAQLVLVFAITTTLWGLITGNVFGVGPGDMQSAGGLWAGVGSAWSSLAFLWRSDPEAARNLVMKISFGIGFLHLASAHIRQAFALLPDQRGIAEVSWVGFVFGMFTLVWFMFFEALVPPTATLWVLVASWTVIVLFSSPDRNPLKRITFGVLGNLMSIPGAFGDMLSYIRLMAVGLASYYIASAFNGLALQLTEASIWALPGTILVLVFAHALNIGLCLVAIFAHGVRLNMLEFSTNAGVQWVGRPFTPFAVAVSQDKGDS